MYRFMMNQKMKVSIQTGCPTLWMHREVLIDYLSLLTWSCAGGMLRGLVFTVLFNLFVDCQEFVYYNDSLRSYLGLKISSSALEQSSIALQPTAATLYAQEDSFVNVDGRKLDLGDKTCYATDRLQITAILPTKDRQ